MMNWIFQNGDKDNPVVKSAKDYVCNIAGDKVQEVKILLNV